MKEMTSENQQFPNSHGAPAVIQRMIQTRPSTRLTANPMDSTSPAHAGRSRISRNCTPRYKRGRRVGSST